MFSPSSFKVDLTLKQDRALHNTNINIFSRVQKEIMSLENKSDIYCSLQILPACQQSGIVALKNKTVHHHQQALLPHHCAADGVGWAYIP
jgi:hypothetical protein